ncbi:cellulase family glycosylhydrolase [Streptomyces sp. ODS28]|uniref:cellulase family glycosylhydrolase n=1 Tax=Streptomyces sp. ODS28 TaxID=3136688 RepID=UPI0031E72A52
MRSLRTALTAGAAALTLLLTAVTAATAEGTATPGGTPTRAAPRTTPLPRVTDDHGRALTLRGWNVEDKIHRGADALSAITERHFADMAARGFTTARLLVFWDDLEPRRGHYSARYLARVERVLDWARKHRVRVVIDAHQDVFGPRFGHRGIPEWATRTDGLPFTPHPDDWFAEYFEPAVQAAFQHLYEDPDLRRAQARMWQVLAQRFRHHPAVLGYDFLNEPMGRVRDGESLPQAAARIEARQLTPMYGRLARAVRRVDRDAWLFIEPTPLVGEGVPTALGAVADPRPGGRRLVYAPHFYNQRMEAGGDYDPAEGWLERYEAAVTDYPRRHGMPVWVGEWGPADSSLPNMGRFHEDALASMDRYATGWAGYVWCYGGGYCALDAEGRFRPNKGRTMRPYAPAVAGRVLSDGYDPRTAAYRLAYLPRPGRTVTELSLPPSESGWRIRTAGPVRARTDRVPPADHARTVRVSAYGRVPATVTVTPLGR